MPGIHRVRPDRLPYLSKAFPRHRLIDLLQDELLKSKTNIHHQRPCKIDRLRILHLPGHLNLSAKKTGPDIV